MPHQPPWERTRVVKKFSATQRGALKLAARYGTALVCVRHRHDASKTIRYTTVELVVEQARIKRQQPPDEILNLQVAPNEFALIRRLRKLGARWDDRACVWQLSRRVASQLGLLERVLR